MHYRVKNIVIISLMALLVFLPVLSARGGFITIETKTTTSFEENILKLSIEAKNKGNEPAYNIEIGANVQENTRTSKIKDVLNISESYKVDLDFSLDLKYSGKYAAVIFINYTDANQYPFSAVSCLQFVHNENVSSDVFAKSMSASVSDEGKLILDIKNMGEEEKDVTIRLVIPKGLIAERTTEQVVLEASSEKEVEFKIKNFAALPGSSYQIYAILEYDNMDRHYSTITPGIIKVEKEEVFYQKYKIFIIVISAILVILFFIYQFRPKVKL